MKKIILIIIILFTGGCYDYTEINNQAFVSSIGIDYQNDEYELYLEIPSDKKIITSKGSTVSYAFENIKSQISQNPCYTHTKNITITENVAKWHLKEVTDYIIRSPKIRNEVSFIATNNKINEIFEIQKNEDESIGDVISNILKINKIECSFEDLLEKLSNNKIDIYIPLINKENKNISLSGIWIFNDFNKADELDNKKATLINLLDNKKNDLLVTNYYDNKPFALKCNNNKISYKFLNDKVIINISLNMEIIENNPNFDLKKENVYKKIKEDFTNILKNDITSIYNLLKEKKTDILGINDKYYKKTGKDKNMFNKEYEINITLHIDKKGLIYKVNNE